jgi:hypothetical protein
LFLIHSTWEQVPNKRLVHLTPHMFPCHRSHSWISKWRPFLGQKSVPVSLQYYCKWSVMAIFDKNRGCVAIDHRPEARKPHPTYVSLPYITFFDFWWRPFLGQKSEFVSLRYYWKWSFMAIFDKNGGCVAVDIRPEAHTPHYTYVSFRWITFFDLWWRPFLGQNFVGVSLHCHWKWSFMAIFDKNGGCMAFDHRPEARTPHPTYGSFP